MANNKKNVPRLLGAGLACLDIIKADGKIYYYNGGSCGNVVSGLSFLGWKNAVFTGSYRDQAAELLDSNFRRIGVQRIEVNQGSSITPRIIEDFEFDKNKSHRFLHVCPQCGREMPKLSPLNEKSIDKVIVNDYNVFYSDRTSKGIILLRKLFREKGKWTVYEPNSSRNVNSLLNNALDSHIVKFSADKVPVSLAEKIRDQSLNGNTVLIVNTMGEKGLLYCYRKKDNTMSIWKHLDSQPVPHFLDSCGAGDWCTIGMLYHLVYKHPKALASLTQKDVTAALHYGQALAAISCSFLGAQGLVYGEMDEEMEKRLVDLKSNLFNNHLTPAKPPSDLNQKFCSFCLLEK